MSNLQKYKEYWGEILVEYKPFGISTDRVLILSSIMSKLWETFSEDEIADASEYIKNNPIRN